MEIGWMSDWTWSLPIILVTMISHVLLLGLVFRFIVRRQQRDQTAGQGSLLQVSISVIAFTLFAVILHALESACWATAYLLLGALPSARQAMLYSFNAMTTFGHTELGLAESWKLMGALEALNGILLFGVTTAFLFALIVRLNLAGDSGRS